MTNQVRKHIGWFIMAFIFGCFVRLPVSDAIEADTARIINLESIPFHASIDTPPLDSQNQYIFKQESGEYTQQWDTLVTDIEKVHQAGELWIRANLPVIDFKDPVLYLEGVFSRLRVFQDGIQIYPSDKLQASPGWRYNQFHQISLRTDHQPIELFIELTYKHILELGTSRKLSLGERTDILAWAITRQQESVINAIVNLLHGCVLLFSAIMMFMSLFWIGRSGRRALIPFACLILLAALDYLFSANFSFVPVSPIDFSPMVYELFPLTLTILMPVFILLFFLRLYPSRIDVFLRIMIGLHIAIGIAMAFFIIYPGEMLMILSDFLMYIIPLDMIGILIALFHHRSSEWSFKILASAFIACSLLVFVDVLIVLDVYDTTPNWYGWGLLLVLVAYGFKMIDDYRKTHQVVERVSRELESQKLSLIELQQANMKIQVDALKSQINPHFLFNSFSVLLGLIEEKSEKAAIFVQELSRVYRYILLSSDKNLTDLENELHFIEAYKYLLTQRHQEGFHLKIDIPASALSLKIPVLSLQLLVENATKHNVILRQKPLTISIALIDGPALKVVNNLQKKVSKVPSTQMGLKNIVERYKLITDRKVLITETTNTFEVELPLIEHGEERYNHRG